MSCSLFALCIWSGKLNKDPALQTATSIMNPCVFLTNSTIFDIVGKINFSKN
jgi:hypothetical protein